MLSRSPQHKLCTSDSGSNVVDRVIKQICIIDKVNEKHVSFQWSQNYFVLCWALIGIVRNLRLSSCYQLKEKDG